MFDQDLIIAILAGAGIPSALFGLFVRRVEKRIDKANDERDKKEIQRTEARAEHEKMMIRLSMASLQLGEVTAEAVQRIPDANCNGEMKEALQNAKQLQEEYRDFERTQTAKSIV